MGETRQKKSGKRSGKAVKARSTSKVLAIPSSGGRTSSKIASSITDELSELNIGRLSSHSDASSPISRVDSTLIDVRKTDGKGVGVFAARKIPAGTLVIAEPPLIRLTKTQESSRNGDNEIMKENAIREQYNALSTTLRKGYDKLFDTEKPQFSRTKSIFYSNCYNLDQHSEYGGACIGLLASRINHSCSGHNAQFSFIEHDHLDISSDEHSTDETASTGSADTGARLHNSGLMLMHAIKDIPKGKEILSNYVSPYMVSHARQNELQMHYKFTCDCSACSQQGFWADSDERRSQMRMCKARVERSELVYNVNARMSNLGVVSVQESKGAIENLNKLAILLVKEGLQGYDLVQVYRDLAKWSLRSGDTTAGNRWTEKERALSAICFGSGSRQVADIVLRSESRS